MITCQSISNKIVQLLMLTISLGWHLSAKTYLINIIPMLIHISWDRKDLLKCMIMPRPKVKTMSKTFSTSTNKLILDSPKNATRSKRHVTSIGKNSTGKRRNKTLLPYITRKWKSKIIWRTSVTCRSKLNKTDRRNKSRNSLKNSTIKLILDLRKQTSWFSKSCRSSRFRNPL